MLRRLWRVSSGSRSLVAVVAHPLGWAQQWFADYRAQQWFAAMFTTWSVVSQKLASNFGVPQIILQLTH